MARGSVRPLGPPAGHFAVAPAPSQPQGDTGLVSSWWFMALTQRFFTPSDGLLAGPATRDVRQTVNQLAVFAALLTVLSLFTAVHMYIVYMERAPIGWTEAVLSGFATWYPWLLLGPGRVRCSRAGSRSSPAGGACRCWCTCPPASCSACCTACCAPRSGRWSTREPIPVATIIIGQLLLTVLSYWVLVAAYQALAQLPAVPRARAARIAAREPARAGAARGAADAAAPALPLQHAARDLDAASTAIPTPPTR